jgi:hypothetical protein
MDPIMEKTVGRRIDRDRSLRNLMRSFASDPRTEILEIYFKQRMDGQIVVQGSRRLLPKKSLPIRQPLI